MALQGPFAVIADSPAPEVVDALRAAGGFPIIETTWADAPAALAAAEPEAIVLADACPDRCTRGRPGGSAGRAARQGQRSVHAGDRPDPRRRRAVDPGRASPSPPMRRRSAWCGGCRRRSASARCTARSCAASARSPRAANSCPSLPIERSARRGKRACRRARPVLSGALGRGRRAGRPGRRAFASRAPRARCMRATSTAW